MSVPSKHVLTIIRRIYFIFTRVRIETNSNYEITLIYFLANILISQANILLLYFKFLSHFMNLIYDVTRGTDREIVGCKGGMPMEKDGFNNSFFPLQHIFQQRLSQIIYHILDSQSSVPHPNVPCMYKHRLP